MYDDSILENKRLSDLDLFTLLHFSSTLTDTMGILFYAS